MVSLLRMAQCAQVMDRVSHQIHVHVMMSGLDIIVLCRSVMESVQTIPVSALRMNIVAYQIHVCAEMDGQMINAELQYVMVSLVQVYQCAQVMDHVSHQIYAHVMVGLLEHSARKNQTAIGLQSHMVHQHLK